MLWWYRKIFSGPTPPKFIWSPWKNTRLFLLISKRPLTRSGMGDSCINYSKSVYSSSSEKDWNPTPGIHNPWNGIKNPRLSWGAFLWYDPDQDQWSEIIWIMVDQMNRWILVQSGFISSFYLPWSEWSRITDRDPYHPKGTHPWIPLHGARCKRMFL